MAKYINKNWPKGSLIALNSAGAIPYYAFDYEYIDMLGLNDPVISKRKVGIHWEARLQFLPGHNKGDARYVLSRKPDYVIAGTAMGTAVEDPWFLTDLEFRENDEFNADYELRRMAVDVTSMPGYENYPPAKDGSFLFTFYQRR